ncbi:MAG: hypothetical protein JXR94_13230 [Candidatus Hydrogenedentes bacterium]|nr:hypothetical protein [Candidatus Hydrogenedentota bacterium]
MDTYEMWYCPNAAIARVYEQADHCIGEYEVVSISAGPLDLDLANGEEEILDDCESWWSIEAGSATVQEYDDGDGEGGDGQQVAWIMPCSAPAEGEQNQLALCVTNPDDFPIQDLYHYICTVFRFPADATVHKPSGLASNVPGPSVPLPPFGRLYSGAHRMMLDARTIEILWPAREEEGIPCSGVLCSEHNEYVASGPGIRAPKDASAPFAADGSGEVADDYSFHSDGPLGIDDTEVIQPYDPSDLNPPFLIYRQELTVDGVLIKTLWWEWRAAGTRYDAPPEKDYDYYWLDCELVQLPGPP